MVADELTFPKQMPEHFFCCTEMSWRVWMITGVLAGKQSLLQRDKKHPAHRLGESRRFHFLLLSVLHLMWLLTTLHRITNSGTVESGEVHHSISRSCGVYRVVLSPNRHRHQSGALDMEPSRWPWSRRRSLLQMLELGFCTG